MMSSITIRLPLFVFMWLAVPAQKQTRCPNGEVHLEIDVQKLALNYKGQSFQLTLGGLSALSARISADPKILQSAAAATQEWNELLKGLAAGYNSCAVSQQQYNEGLKRIYPRLKEDAADLEQIRQAILGGQQVDTARLRQLLDSYFANLRRFAQAANSQQVEAIRAVVEASEVRILENQEKIFRDVEELKQRLGNVPKPADVQKEISGLKQELLAKADEAEREYTAGYELFQRYQFRQSIPHLQRAIAAVPLPAFYVALSAALLEMPDLVQAEQAAREGLAHVAGKPDDEAALSSNLGLILRDKNGKGDLDEAERYTRRALHLMENIHGSEHSKVAISANNLGLILHAKGNLDEAERYTKQALEIDEKRHGADSPDVAIDANNLGTILLAKGDLAGAQFYIERALHIDEKILGPDDPKVAIRLNNLGQVLQDAGDLKKAQIYTERALRIDKSLFGEDNPEVAKNASNLGTILQAKGNLPEAQLYLELALRIAEKLYEPDHPNVAIYAGNLGAVLQARGSLEKARTLLQRAQNIAIKRFGPNSPEAMSYAAALHEIQNSKR